MSKLDTEGGYIMSLEVDHGFITRENEQLPKPKVFLSDITRKDSYTLQPRNFAKVGGQLIGVGRDMVAKYPGIDWAAEFAPAGGDRTPGTRERRKSTPGVPTRR